MRILFFLSFAIGFVIMFSSCEKNSFVNDDFDLLKTKTIEHKDNVYKTFDDVYVLINDELNHRSHKSKEELTIEINSKIASLKNVHHDILMQSINQILNDDFSELRYSKNHTSFLNEIHFLAEEFEKDLNYEKYLLELLNLGSAYQNSISWESNENTIIFYGSVIPYWIENNNKWEKLNIQRGNCDNIPQAAIDAAVVGCGVGAVAGAVGTPAGSLAACIVGGVISATGATLWQAIKCAAAQIFE